MDTQQKITTINAIKEQELSIEKTKQDIATRKELIEEHIQSKQTWLDVEAAKEELARVKQKFAAELSADGFYNNQLEDLAQLKDKLKSEKEILSDLVVGYVLETKERQLEMNNQGDARDLVIRGTLGKKGKYQQSLFNQGDN